MGAHSADGGDIQWPQHDQDAGKPFGGGGQEPPTPEEQIDGAINEASMHRAVISRDTPEARSHEDPHQAIGGGGAGGSFSMAPDEVHATITEMHSIKDAIDELKADLQAARSPIQRPAADDPSTNQADGSKLTVRTAEMHVDNCHAYTQDYINKLAKSVGDVEDVEQVNAKGLGKQDPGTGGESDGSFI